MKRSALLATVAALGALTASACSVVGTEDDSQASKRVVLLTHDSFVLPEKLQQRFEEESGVDLVLRASGDGGQLTNKLVLSKANPQGDVAFGVDNAFGGRALAEGVFAPYDVDLPDGVSQFTLPGDDEETMAPVDTGGVCVNVDDTWFAQRDLAPPTSLDDLTDPAYRDLFVTPGAATSSPGLAFLLTTIAEYGDRWPAYWRDLMDNGTKITSGWSDAYQVDFTQGGGGGDRPIVLSYDSSPAFTLAEDGTSTTSALLDTCYRQVEYAGLLDGAANPDGGRELIEFLLTDDVQAALPESMYVFPVVDGVELPQDWAEYAEQAPDPVTVDPAEIDANREEWLRAWSDATS